jgi:elongation factor P--(R)-beta-lysine ligase
LLRRTRQFFTARGLLEVETPLLSAAAASELHLESLEVRRPGGTPLGWLQTSPEYPMKRLLAAGSGDIWQLARVFRGGETGGRHNPEFSLLEWYRLDWDTAGLMDEVAAFVGEMASGLLELGPELRLSYREAFERHAGLDPFAAEGRAIVARLRERGVPMPEGLELDRNAGLDLALATLVEPALDPLQPTFLFDFPASHAALARIRPGDPPVAERFELFLGGMELANGYCELADPYEQQARFEADQAARRARGRPTPPLDHRLIAALAHGLPDCSGVALGFDRLLMIMAGAGHINDVLAFPFASA